MPKDYKKVSLDKWEQRKKDLDNFLLQYQYASGRDVQKAGHWTTLLKFYRNLNNAKRSLQISEEYINLPAQMQKSGYETYLKLQDKDNIFTLLSYDINYKSLEKIYNLSTPTLKKIVAEIREKRGISSMNVKYRFVYGIKNYLELYERQEKTENDLFLIEVIEKYLILPIVDDVKDKLNLEEILQPLNLIERLFYKTCDLDPREEVMKELRTIIRKQKFSERWELKEKLKCEMMAKIKRGDYSFYLSEKDKEEMLSLLGDKEREVIRLRYLQIDSRTPEQISEVEKLTREGVRFIEGGAIKKIREYVQVHPVIISEIIPRLDGQLTEKEGIISTLEEMVMTGDFRKVSEYIQQEKRKRQLSKSVYSTELSTHAKNFLRGKGIGTVGELIKLVQEEGDKIKNYWSVGEKTYNEIKEFVSGLYEL